MKCRKDLERVRLSAYKLAVKHHCKSVHSRAPSKSSKEINNDGGFGSLGDLGLEVSDEVSSVLGVGDSSEGH